MKYLCSIFMLLVSATCFGEPNMMNALSKIRAKDVHYTGDEIHLTGEVNIDHKFGEIFCNKAVVFAAHSPAGVSSSFNAEKIDLFGDVIINLKDGSSIHSDTAFLNCITLEGVFNANAPNQVVWLTHMQDQDKKVPVKTSSSSLKVKMKKGENGDEYAFSELKGEGAVCIEYQQPEKE